MATTVELVISSDDPTPAAYKLKVTVDTGEPINIEEVRDQLAASVRKWAAMWFTHDNAEITFHIEDMT